LAIVTDTPQREFDNAGVTALSVIKTRTNFREKSINHPVNLNRFSILDFADVPILQERYGTAAGMQ
jgi:hypothetical protein